MCDTTPPDISVTTPEDGGKYGRGETVNADYECRDEAGGSGVESCVGDKAKGEAIDTSTLGPKTFTVTAKDRAGNESRKQVTYEVVDRTAPTIDLTTPPDGLRTSSTRRLVLAGNTSEKSHAYRVIYDFAGFFRPVNGLPVVNEVRAGQAVPVKFSLER